MTMLRAIPGYSAASAAGRLIKSNDKGTPSFSGTDSDQQVVVVPQKKKGKSARFKFSIVALLAAVGLGGYAQAQENSSEVKIKNAIDQDVNALKKAQDVEHYGQKVYNDKNLTPEEKAAFDRSGIRHVNGYQTGVQYLQTMLDLAKVSADAYEPANTTDPITDPYLFQFTRNKVITEDVFADVTKSDCILHIPFTDANVACNNTTEHKKIGTRDKVVPDEPIRVKAAETEKLWNALPTGAQDDLHALAKDFLENNSPESYKESFTKTMQVLQPYVLDQTRAAHMQTYVGEASEKIPNRLSQIDKEKKLALVLGAAGILLMLLSEEGLGLASETTGRLRRKGKGESGEDVPEIDSDSDSVPDSDLPPSLLKTDDTPTDGES